MSQIATYFSETLLGGDELIAGLEALDQKIQRKFSRTALRAGQGPMVAAIKAIEEPHSITGLLQSGIRGLAGRGDRPGITSQLISAITDVGGFLQFGTSSSAEKSRLEKNLISKYGGNLGAKYRVYYARAVEMGHEPSGWYAHVAGAVPVPPHPFARPGFDETVDESADIIEQSLSDQISEEWASGNTGAG